MAGLSKTGSNFAVAFSLPRSQNPDVDGYLMVNASSVREFTMSISINSMPRGHVSCTLNHMSAIPVSGAYGSLIVQGHGAGGKGDLAFGIYVANLTQSHNTSDSVTIAFDFIVGSHESDLKMKNYACTGTSTSAMKECVKQCGMECIARYSDTGANADAMTWRMVNGNFEENMNYVVSRSFVPSDMMFWGFDEQEGKIVISTFNTEKASKTRSFMFYSKDALVSTLDAVYYPKGMAGSSIFKYHMMSRADNTSQYRQAMLPNLIVDTTSNKGVKETGDCGGECLDIIMNAAGANDMPPGIRPPKDTTGIYGEPMLAMSFPMNGHKKYAVANTIRERLAAEYSRVARVRIFNHLGPRVGTCVYLVANNVLIDEGQNMPDMDYTARYIVIGKYVNKITTATSGTLGVTGSTMTTEYETYLELATNFQYSRNAAKEYDVVMDAVKQVIDTLEERND